MQQLAICVFVLIMCSTLGMCVSFSDQYPYPAPGMTYCHVVLISSIYFLHIMDVLVRELVYVHIVKISDNKTYHGVDAMHLKKLEQTINSCGV